MSTSPLRIAVAGATGRMGQAVVRAILQSRDYVLAAAFARNAHPDLGKNAGTFAGAQPSSIELTEVSAAGMAEGDALIDFTAPAASLAFGRLAADAHVVHVLGSTGFSPEQEAQVTALAGESVIIKSSNMSLGVTLLASLVRQAAKALSEFDVEILEMHHRSKVDAPSGTALLLGEAVAEGRSRPLSENSVRSRDGNIGPRKPGAIGFASLRGGTVVGEHSVMLAGPHERVVLSHVAEDRMIFARGALAAARWAQGKSSGLYSMADVLGLDG